MIVILRRRNIAILLTEWRKISSICSQTWRNT